MTKLSWEQLDACETPDAIADLLRQYGTYGLRSDTRYCPLARATGWQIGVDYARTDYARRKLTAAQKAFAELFDQGLFPELDLNATRRIDQ